MAFAIKFVDGFTETSNTPLASHTPDLGVSWSILYQTGSAKWQVVGSTDLAAPDAGYSNLGVVYTSNISGSYNNDQWCEFWVIDSYTGIYLNCMVLRASDSSNMYLIRFNDGVLDMWKCVAGTWTKIATGSGFADAKFIGFAVSGTTLTAYVNGVSVLSTIDTSLTSGKPGFGGGKVVTTAPGNQYLGTSQNLDMFMAGNGSYLERTPYWDLFTDSNVELTSHTPNRGLSWTRVKQISAALLRAASSGKCEPVTNYTNDGVLYTAEISGGISGPDYRVGYKIPIANPSDYYWYLVVRYQDNNNFYALEVKSTTTQLYKVVGGTWTAVGSSFSIAANQFVELEIVGTAIKAYINGTLKASGTVTDFATKGKPGLGAGALRVATGDINTAYYTQNFRVVNLNIGGDIPVNISGTVAAASSLTGDVEGATEVKGTIAGASSLTGDTEGATEVAGVIAASSVVTSDVEGSSEVTGTIAASSVVTSDVEGSSEVTGTIAASSSASGDVEGSSEVTGTIAGASAVDGDVEGSTEVAGVIAASSSASGDVEVAVELSGLIAALSSLTGALEVSSELAGVIAAASVLDGDVEAAVELAGLIAAVSTFEGDVASAMEIAGTIAAVSTLAGDVESAVELAGLIAASSTLSGDLSVTTELMGTIAALSALDGDVSGASEVSGVIQAASTVSGDVEGAVEIAGVVAGVSALDGDVEAAVELSGLIQATSALVGDVEVAVELSGLIAALSGLTGDVESATEVAGLIAAVSTVTGTVEGSSEVSGLIAALSSLTGDVEGATEVAGLIAAVSALTGRVVAEYDGPINTQAFDFWRQVAPFMFKRSKV